MVCLKKPPGRKPGPKDRLPRSGLIEGLFLAESRRQLLWPGQTMMLFR